MLDVNIGYLTQWLFFIIGIIAGYFGVAFFIAYGSKKGKKRGRND